MESMVYGKFPHTRISFLHLDMDVYEPTLFALEQCWDRIIKGGIVVIDNYNAVFGATKAIDEFLHHMSVPHLGKSRVTRVPCFIVK